MSDPTTNLPACDCPDPALCQRLKRHIHGNQWRIWNSSAPKAVAYKRQWLKQAGLEKDAGLLAIKAEAVRGECRHFGERLSQKCGSPLHRCRFDGVACSRFVGCQDAARVCATCPHHEAALVINMGAGGLGDALLGLLAVGGLKAEHPGRFITYKVHPAAIPFIRLFDGGFDKLAPHDFDHNKAIGPHEKPGDRQMNRGYDDEVRNRGRKPRWERYCDNIGAKGIRLPLLREPDRLKELGSEWKGSVGVPPVSGRRPPASGRRPPTVVLSPFSTWTNREWRIESWITLARMLTAAGYRVVAIDSRADRLGPMPCEKRTAMPAEEIVGMLLNAACLVGNDSGMAHLSGILGKPTIALCGQTTGFPIFGAYDRVKWLEGSLDCSGCWWQEPYQGTRCDPTCAALASITPARILSIVDREASRCIVSMAFGDEYRELSDLTFPRMKAYAQRCGADFVPLIDRQFAGLHIHYEKYQVGRLLEDYDQVLWLDADVLVRPEAPNLFERVPGNRFAAFDEAAAWRDGPEPFLREAAETLGQPCPAVTSYFNMGVFLAPKNCRDLFRPPEAQLPGEMPEQNHTNFRLLAEGYPVFKLEEAWNVMPPGIGGSPREEYRGPRHFVHFAGSGSVEERVKRVREELEYKASAGLSEMQQII